MKLEYSEENESPGSEVGDPSNTHTFEPDEQAASEISTQDRLLGRLERVETELIARESRFFLVALNFARAIFPAADMDNRFRRAATTAFGRWLLSRAPFVATLSLGGLIATFLGLQANLLLLEQNNKIDLQNQLTIVGQHRSEAARYEEKLAEIETFIAEVKLSKGDDRSILPGMPLERRLSVLSQSFRPYRLIEGDAPFRPETVRERLGFLSRLLPPDWLEDTQAEAHFWIPQLSEKPLSPERGELLKRLSEERIWLMGRPTPKSVDHEGQLASWASASGIDFSNAYLAQGEWLSALRAWSINLRGAVFSNIEMESVVVIQSDLREVDLSLSDLKFSKIDGSLFNRAILVQTDFMGANLNTSNFTEADLRKANFHDASVEDTIFLLANLRGANFSEVRGLSATQLETACIDQETVLPPLEQYRFDEYSEPERCVELWGEQHRQRQWYSFEEQRPDSGSTVRVRGALHTAEGKILSCIERTFLWDGGNVRLSGSHSAGLTAGRNPTLEERLITWSLPVEGDDGATHRVVGPEEQIGSCQEFWEESYVSTGRR